ncbi:hypothetical protein [Rhizobium miluonense]|uniref:Uncharacterized protein n=1 Tax=Rhizobium miluonense TaxID=411945 RepID=A0A1C3UA25_9HYPH|nr:hypothetical protein [Rhizobium miluonense]SCB12346.1 hypothetical protein GA0061102_1002234 [Rhizobium miluonense]
MVNNINSLRFHNTHVVSRTPRAGQTTNNDTSQISRSTGSVLGGSVSPAHSNSKFSILLAGLSKNTGTTKAATPAAAPKVVNEVTSSDFMKSLTAKLKASVNDPVSGPQAKAMLAALKNGTLSVSDPTKGVTIKAWNPDDKASKAAKPEKIATDNWNEFLKDHLKRSDKGSLIRTSDGSYIDKPTARNAFFGSLNGKYYYVTWPAEVTASGKPASA